jgi:hypothetical protein
MSYLAQNTYYTITYYNLQSVFPRRRLHVLAGVTVGEGDFLFSTVFVVFLWPPFDAATAAPKKTELETPKPAGAHSSAQAALSLIRRGVSWKRTW